jgi:hypothetical protein
MLCLPRPAAIRYGLGEHHTYEFVEGAVPYPMAPGKNIDDFAVVQFINVLQVSKPSRLKMPRRSNMLMKLLPQAVLKHFMTWRII